MSENTTGSDSKQLQHSSSTKTTENRKLTLQTLKAHRKTHFEACKPMHISDARNKQREAGSGDGIGSSRSNRDINHEEECNSVTVSVSNSIGRYRGPNNTPRVTGTQSTPSPSSTASREGIQICLI